MDANQMGLELVAPFLSRREVNELCSGRLWEEYRRRKMEIYRWRWARAVWRQRQIAKEMRNYQGRFVDGVGQLKATIDPEYRKAVEILNGHEFKDPDFRRAALKSIPELRMPAPPPRLRVNGFRSGGMVPGENPGTAAKLGVETSAHETPAERVPC